MATPRPLVLEHPAIAELLDSFKLHDDFVRRKLAYWVDRWISVGEIRAEVPVEDALTLDTDKLMDTLFGRLVNDYVSKHCQPLAAKNAAGDGIFKMRAFMLNAQPSTKKGGVVNGN